mmetsp:Transcript_34019/g.82481  ORF Transcript_34019/g.82481 Transcript_34019/m.82481 type:complete len:177 (-) Transcript_34019:184-714(-)
MGKMKMKAILQRLKAMLQKCKRVKNSTSTVEESSTKEEKHGDDGSDDSINGEQVIAFAFDTTPAALPRAQEAKRGHSGGLSMAGTEVSGVTHSIFGNISIPNSGDGNKEPLTQEGIRQREEVNEMMQELNLFQDDETLSQATSPAFDHGSRLLSGGGSALRGGDQQRCCSHSTNKV